MADRLSSSRGRPIVRRDVYLVGLRYGHHAEHSGYEGFGRYVGKRLEPPISIREAVPWKATSPRSLSRGLVRWIEARVILTTGRPGYSLRSLLTELWAALHMLAHRKSIYHLLYGDTDLWLLGSISRRVGATLVASFHQPPSGLQALEIDRAIVQDLSAVVLLSDSQRDHFDGLLPTERTYIVPHGVDAAFFRPGPGAFGHPPACITVGGHWRDFGTLAEAMRLVWEARPEVRLIAVGTRGPDSNSGDASLYFADPRVEFLDGISDDELLHAYRRASMAVLSVWDATANNAVLEAMACGLPIVATDVGGIGEYTGRESAILCPPYQAETLAEGMLRVLSEPSLAASMSAASRGRALVYSYCRVADRLRQVYAELPPARGRVTLLGERADNRGATSAEDRRG